MKAPYWQDWERRKRDLAEELESHLRMAVADRMARGESYEEARREAMKEFGNVPLVADVTRERWGWLRMERLTQDLRYALRTLGRERGFTAVAVLILALGIGANVVVFSVVHTILLRPLPFVDADRLVWIAPPDSGHNLSGSTYSADAYEDLRAMNRSYTDVTAYYAFSSPDNLKVTGAGDPKPVTDISVAGNFFQMLGVTPELGRGFNAEEQRNGGVVLVTHAYWKRYLGADPAIIGKAIMLNNKPIPVVGVLPESFDFGAVFQPGLKVDMFDPQKMDDIRYQGNALTLIGRLKPGVTLEQARTEATELFPKFYWQKRQPLSLGAYKDAALPIWLKEYVSGALRRSLTVLWGAVGMILLIVCVNLSNLMLARAATRTREIAIRASLGSSAARIIWLLLAESAVLGIAASVAGMFLAYFAVRLFFPLIPASVPHAADALHLNASVLLFTVAVSCLTVMACSLIPALHLRKLDLAAVLKQSAGHALAGGTSRSRQLIVVAQIAVCCVLCVGAALLSRSLLALLHTPTGYRSEGILVMHADAPASELPEYLRAIRTFGTVIEEIQHIPGVQSAAAVMGLPTGKYGSNGNYMVEGAQIQAGQDPTKMNWPQDLPWALFSLASPRYFSTVGIRLINGRDFTARDQYDAPFTAIISESLARQSFGTSNPIGRRI